MTENVNANIPPAKGFDEFQTLSSTKQNIELFKILSAIAEEIEGLRQSTERRFHLIESLVQQNGKKKYIYILSSLFRNIEGLLSTKCSCKTLQTLLLFYVLKNHSYFVFHFMKLYFFHMKNPSPAGKK